MVLAWEAWVQLPALPEALGDLGQVHRLRSTKALAIPLVWGRLS